MYFFWIIQNAVDTWNPLTDPTPIHSWLHPWLPIMGNVAISNWVYLKCFICLIVRDFVKLVNSIWKILHHSQIWFWKRIISSAVLVWRFTPFSNLILKENHIVSSLSLKIFTPFSNLILKENHIVSSLSLKIPLLF